MDISSLILGTLITVSIGFSVILGVALFIFWIRIFYHLATHKVAGKKHWIILMFLYSYVAAFAYYFKVKKKFDKRAAEGDADAQPETYPEAGDRLKLATSIGIGLWVIGAVVYLAAMLIISVASDSRLDATRAQMPLYLYGSNISFEGKEFSLFQSRSELNNSLYMASYGFVHPLGKLEENIYVVRYASSDPAKRISVADMVSDFMASVDKDSVIIERFDTAESAEGPQAFISYADRISGQVSFVKFFPENDAYDTVRMVTYGTPLSESSIEDIFADPAAYAQTQDYAVRKSDFLSFKID